VHHSGRRGAVGIEMKKIGHGAYLVKTLTPASILQVASGSDMQVLIMF
jgi:hypothetical protein